MTSIQVRFFFFSVVEVVEVEDFFFVGHDFAEATFGKQC